MEPAIFIVLRGSFECLRARAIGGNNIAASFFTKHCFILFYSVKQYILQSMCRWRVSLHVSCSQQV